jgi:hypothetical protein
MRSYPRRALPLQMLQTAPNGKEIAKSLPEVSSPDVPIQASRRMRKKIRQIMHVMMDKAVDNEPWNRRAFHDTISRNHWSKGFKNTQRRQH